MSWIPQRFIVISLTILNHETNNNGMRSLTPGWILETWDEVVMGWRRSGGWGGEGWRAHRGDKVGSGLSSQGSPSEFEKAHMGPDPGMVEVDTWVKTWGQGLAGRGKQLVYRPWGGKTLGKRGRLGRGEGERACRAQHSEPWTLPRGMGLLF